MISLEVAGLAVEAGGLTVVRDLDLVLAAGDKVGVVGRNGAGKTPPCARRGAAPAAGTVRRRGAVGYLRQDPRQHRADDGTTGIEYLLAARGLSSSSGAWRRPGSCSRSWPRRNTSRGSRGSRTTTSASADTGARRKPARSSRASASPRTGSACPWARCPEASGGELADPLRRLGPAAAGRAHEPPRRGREGMADALPPRATAGLSW